MPNLDFTTFAQEVAREAGAILLQFQAKGVTPEYKGAADVVTAADRASEKHVVSRLRDSFPSHSIVAEEGSGVDNKSEYCWHIDPLDGTTNFAHGFPFWCVSIGLEKAGEGLVGVVYDPNRDEMFMAERGSGAYLNNRRIRVSSVDKLENGLFATGFPPANRRTNPNVFYFHQFSSLSHGARRAGSAALDLCAVAAGRLEGFWEFGLQSWDVSAGATIVLEAGGHVTDMKGGKYSSSDRNVNASNGKVHQAMLDLFAKLERGDFPAGLPPLPQA
jgi:myo-inositol-1(or 4)-monophosphatase